MPLLKLKPRQKLRLLLFCLLGLAVLFFLYRGIVPGGQISYHTDFKDKSNFISVPGPHTRVALPGDAPLRIIGDPVYLSLHTPRRFDKAKISLKFRSIGIEQPIIESGVLVDSKLWRYDLQAVYNANLESLCASWQQSIHDGVRLCQKEKRFESIEDLFESDVNKQQIVTYNYDPAIPFIFKGYASTSQEYDIETDLLGAHELLVYVKDEDLSLDFRFRDRNLDKKPDPVDINIYYDKTLIDTRHLDDDGVSTDSGQLSPARDLQLLIKHLPEGLYKVELKASNDIVTENIRTKASKLSFSRRLRLAPSEQALTLFGDASKYQAISTYPQGLQTIKIGDKEIVLAETYKQYSLDAKQGKPEKISLERTGIELSSDGVFSLTSDALVNPDWRKLPNDSSPDGPDFSYIVADYQDTKTEGDWHIADYQVDLGRAYRENRTYSLIISVPGLRADDQIKDYVELKDIRIDLEGKNLFEMLKEKYAK